MCLFLNFMILLLYFLLASFVFALLYFFGILPSDTQVRFKFNILDFYLDFIKMSIYDFKHYDKNAFKESGIVIYVGRQGSGKTISMMHDVLMLQHKYPKSKIMTNVGFKGSACALNSPNDLLTFTNGIYGVITPIDELGVLFRRADSKIFRLKCVR